MTVLNDKIYVCGPNFDRVDVIYVEVYDPTLDKWKLLKVMSAFVVDSVKLVANNGKLWFFGKRITKNNRFFNLGDEFYVTEIYDPACDQWTNGPFKHHEDTIKAIGMIPFHSLYNMKTHFQPVKCPVNSS